MVKVREIEKVGERERERGIKKFYYSLRREAGKSLIVGGGKKFSFIDDF